MAGQYGYVTLGQHLVLCLFCAIVYFVMAACLLCCVCFSFSVLSQEIGWKERLQTDLFCVRWDIAISAISDTNVSGALERKGKQAYLYSAFYILCISQSAPAWITQFYLKIQHACLSFVCVHQMAPPLTEVRDI